jgi:hypothetical protein
MAREDTFRLNPMEQIGRYPDEPIFTRYLSKLPDGTAEFRVAPGRTEFSPTGPLIVGCRYDISITYFPEETPLPGGTRVAFSIPPTWTQPRPANGLPGSASAACSGGGRCGVELTGENGCRALRRSRLLRQPRCATPGRRGFRRFPR